MTTQYQKRLLKYDQPLPKKATIPQNRNKKAPKIYIYYREPWRATIETNYQAPKLLGREGGIIFPFALKNIETKFRQK